MSLQNNIIKLFFQKRFDFLLAFKSVVMGYLLFVVSPVVAQERNYQAPPSTQTNVTVPYIAEADMAQCVQIYNEAIWLKEELDKVQVNLSQPASVESYNSKVSLYSQKADYFNLICAGKNSEQAVEAAQHLNQKNNS